MNKDTLSLVALICGLISIFVVPLLFGTLGIVLGVMGMERSEPGSSAHANARVGFIAGIVGIVLWAVTLAAMSFLGFDGFLSGVSADPPSAF